MTIALPTIADEHADDDLIRGRVAAGHGAEAAEWNVAGFLAGSGHDTAAAWIEGHRHFSYAQVRAGAAVIADELRRNGVTTGEPVALFARNGFFWIAAYLAILSAGMVAVPLSATHSPAEAWRRAQSVGCRAATVGAGLHWPTDLSPTPTLTETALPPGWEAGQAARLATTPVRAAADAVYVFTSTDPARAVRITHGNVRANTQSILDGVYLESPDRTLVVVPFSNAFGASLLHTHLRIGASLVHHGSATVPETIVDALERFNCTEFAGSATAFTALVRNSSFTWRRLPQLRLLQHSDGSLEPVIHDELRRAHPSARLFTTYGRPEATARLSCLSADARGSRAGSVGRGLPGVRLRVVDAGGADVDVGRVGEIWASGGNISPGYLNDDVATARTLPGGILRTGDYATIDEDGYIYPVAGPAPTRP